MKRKIALLMALVFVFICTVPVAFAEDVDVNIIEAEAPVITDNGENKDISVTVSCSALADGAESAPVYLFAVRKDKENGKIDKVAVDSCTLGVGDSDTLTASLPNGGDDYEYMVYVWDSFENQRTVINQPPAEPTELEVTGTTVSTASLSWAVADDDRKAVSSYNIYRDGNYVGSSEDTSYTGGDLDFNDTYTYEVTAVDASGLESEYKASVEATTAEIPTITYVSKKPDEDPDATQTNSENIAQTWSGKGTFQWTAPDVKDGLGCHTTTFYVRQNANGTTTDLASFFYIKSSFDYIDDTTNEIVAEVTYFDEKPTGAAETISLTYQKGSARGTKTAAFKDTGYWRTVTFVIDDAEFTQAALTDNGKTYNARFKTNTQEALKVHQVAVVRADEYVKPAASIKMKEGALVLRDILVYRDDALVEYDAAGDEDCLLIVDGSYLEMDVETDDDSETEVNTNVNIEIAYYDEGEGDITLEYAGGTEPKVISRTDSGEWKTALIKLDDATFDGSLSGVTGRELDLKISGNGDLHIKSVRVY